MAQAAVHPKEANQNTGRYFIPSAWILKALAYWDKPDAITEFTWEGQQMARV